MTIVSGFAEREWLNNVGRFILFTGSAAQAYALEDAKETPGKCVTLKNQGTGVVTISAVSGQFIDGSATATLSTQYAVARYVSDGKNWNII